MSRFDVQYPRCPNNKFMFHAHQQKNDEKTPEQLTSVTKSILLHAQTITSPSPAINNIFESDDVLTSTDHEESPGDESQILPSKADDTTDIMNDLLKFITSMPAETLSELEYQLQAELFQQISTSELEYPDINSLEYEVVLPTDQAHYQAIELSSLTIEPLKTNNTLANANKAVIKSDDLIEPPKGLIVKSTYAGTVTKNTRKTTKRQNENRTTSKATSQSTLSGTVRGANSTRNIQRKINIKSNGSKKQPVHHEQKPLPKQTNTFDSKLASLKRKLKENILPTVPSKKPFLERDQVMVTKDDKTFSLFDISIEQSKLVNGVKSKRFLKEVKLAPSSEIESNKMTLSDCIKTLQRNNVQVFKVPMNRDKVLEKYVQTLEENTKIKKI